MSSRHVFKTSSIRLQRNNFTSSKTSRKMPWTSWHQDVLKTSSRPTNACWVYGSIVYSFIAFVFYCMLSWRLLKYIETELQGICFYLYNTAQKMKFSIKDFLSKCDQIRSFLRIWSHSLRKSLMEIIIFCAV